MKAEQLPSFRASRHEDYLKSLISPPEQKNIRATSSYFKVKQRERRDLDLVFYSWECLKEREQVPLNYLGTHVNLNADMRFQLIEWYVRQPLVYSPASLLSLI